VKLLKGKRLRPVMPARNQSIDRVFESDLLVHFFAWQVSINFDGCKMVVGRWLFF
jgi:hypothetical protein